MTDQTVPEVQKPEVSIQQLNLGYNVQQDRLLLRVGLSDDIELVLWITNRIARQLWQLLNGETYLPTASSIQADALPADAMEQFKQEAQAVENLKKMDFATKYQPRKEMLNDGALLAIQLKLSGDHIKHLDVVCLEGVTVGLNLPQPLILALCNMLQLSVRESGWNIGAKLMPQPAINIDEPVDGVTQKNKVLH